MSFINGSQFAGLSSNAEFPLQREQNESAQNDLMRWQPASGDGYQNTPIALPIAYTGQSYGGNDGSNFGSGASGSSTSNNFFQSILQNLNNAISQLTSYLSWQTGTGSASTGTTTGTGYTNSPTQAQQPENYFTSATASSTGDPHDAFNGTTGNGANVNDKWDSMQSHGDLLDSNSFWGGYQVSTTTTAPNAQGVTYNSSATVTTNGGNTAVTMNQGGSYSVTENGRNVTLTQGQATQIGHGESVTLNADNSLTITDTNHQGGTVTTTLSNNGNGVDVSASGSNVDLGGYLVNKTETSADPVAFESQGGITTPVGIDEPWMQNTENGYQLPSYATSQFSTMQNSPTAYGNDTEPLGAGEIEFA
jgi:hypothetical protein